MDFKLSEGALVGLLTRDAILSNIKLQVMAYKELQGGVEETKFRVLVNDGSHTYQNVLVVNPALHNLFKMGKLEKFTIINANNFTISTIQEKKVLIINEIDIIKPGPEIGRKIGNPAVLDPRNLSAAPAASDQGPLAAAYNASSASQVPPIPQRSRPSTTTTMPSGYIEESDILPMRDLTPYTNRWAIKARVTSKREKKTWSNARGEGTLFSFDILDKSGTEMRVTAFKAECEKYYDLIEVGQTYYIQNGQVKQAGPYGPRDREYEITLNYESRILKTEGTTGNDIPMGNYHFIPIEDIEKVEENTYVDVIGVIKEVGQVETIVSKKSNQELQKRDIQVVDQKAGVSFTIWGDNSVSFTGQYGDILCVKGCRVSTFNNRCINGGDFKLNPTLPEAEDLKTWWLRGGQAEETRTITSAAGASKSKANHRFVAELTLENFHDTASAQKQPSSWVTGTILISNRNPVYKSCKSLGCNKKLEDMGNGFYKCVKCNKEMSDYDYRWMMGVNVSDASGDTWLTLFDDLAQKIMGKSANELVVQLYGGLGNMAGEADKLNEYIATKLVFNSMCFRLSSKFEVFKDESRLRNSVWECRPIDHKSYGNLLAKQIEQMSR